MALKADLPIEWLTQRRFNRLSDRAWRTYTGSLMQGMSDLSDGLIDRVSLRFLHPEGVDDATTAELVDAGLWSVVADGVQMCEWSRHQTTAEAVEEYRENARKRAKDYRDRQRSARSANVTRDVSRDVTPRVDVDIDQTTGSSSNSSITTNVTRDDSGFRPLACSKHLDYDSTCNACKSAYRSAKDHERAEAESARKRREEIRALPVDVRAGTAVLNHDHKWMPDGTCRFPSCIERIGVAS